MGPQEDWLHQWQSMVAAWNRSAAFGVAPPSSGAPGDDGNPYVGMADAFSAALRAAAETRAQDSVDASVRAMQQLADFLRARFNDLSAFAAIGPMREHQQRWERMLDAQRRAEQARGRLARLWSDALREAAQAFAARCLQPESVASLPAALYDEWIECAEDAYARMAHGEAFCGALAELINSLGALRKELQAALELWAKQLDLPTRSELNRLHRAVKCLRAELAEVRARAPTPKSTRQPAVQPKPRSRAAPNRRRPRPRRP